MSVDIIKYAAINNATNKLLNENVQLQYGTIISNLVGPACLNCYCLINNYTLLSGGTTVTVCDTGIVKNAGACCLWTVPTGVSIAQFQIWGAGSSSVIGQCCMIAPFGASGGYTVVTMPVATGATYTMCAGCAYGTSTSLAANCPGFSGCPSFVTGTGINLLCAAGGPTGGSCLQAWCTSSTYWSCTCPCFANYCCRYQTPYCVSSGGCICTNGAICDASCASCGIIPTSYVAQPTGSNVTTSLYGIWQIPSMMGAACYDTNVYGCFCAPPVVSTTHTFSCSCNFVFNSGTSFNTYCTNLAAGANTGVLCYPGFGGFPTTQYSGALTGYGDLGRGGMVRLTYC